MFDKAYKTEGPLGLPMSDEQAQALDLILKTIPSDLRVLGRCAITKATSSLLEGERADVSYIATEAVDRQGEILLMSGMDDSHFAMNPIVTLNHDYYRPPVGVSKWRQKFRDGQIRGVKAKTHYPPKPSGYDTECWPADDVWALVRSGLMAGKSVGFVPLEARSPTKAEEELGAGRVTSRWLLVEYACCYLPVNQECVVEEVAKAMKSLGLGEPRQIPFTPFEEVVKAVEARINGLVTQEMIQATAKDALDRARGRV